MPFPHKAIVLAAGLGLRMRPLTETMPKPLVKVAGVPLIDRALDFLHSAGVNEAVVNASYLGDMLAAHLAARKQGMNIQLSREDVPLETGGGIRDALPLLNTPRFFAVNSDVICINGARHALARLHEAWDDARMDALLLLHPMQTAVGFEGPGDFFLDEQQGVRRRDAHSSAPYVFTGIQLIHARLFEHCPPEGPFSLNVLYNRGMHENGTLPRVHALVHDGAWLHVGDIAGLHAAEAWFAQSSRKTS